MPGSITKKRKVGEGVRGKISWPVKKVKKQRDYRSSSDNEVEDNGEEFKAVNLQDSDDQGLDTTEAIAADESATDDDDKLLSEYDTEELTDASNSDSGSESNDEREDAKPSHKKRKRHDPEAFATSMSKILGAKLAISKRRDPVLARSAQAIQSGKEMIEATLERKARQTLKADKREALDKGRVKDVLGASTAFDTTYGRGDGGSTQETMELEKRLRKTAQRGVVTLFNAVRAAQVKGEQAAKEARDKGLVGQGRRDERVNEMSKKGFLDLIAGAGGALKSGAIQEA